MSEIFEVKRTKLFYEYNGCKCENIGDVLSFKGVAISFRNEGRSIRKDTIIGFYDYKEDSYYWFYENFDKFYLNKLNGLNCYSELEVLETALNEI